MDFLKTFTTDRLILRPFTLADAPVVQHLAGAYEIASNVLSIPYPYPDGLAEEWISHHKERFDRGEEIIFAVTRTDDSALTGCVSLRINRQHEHGELGYWIGAPYWGQGYATEAAGIMVAYGFRVLSLRRIYCRHMTRNPASGKVMEKLGMTFEGTLRQHAKKFFMFEDVKVYSILREEFDPKQNLHQTF